MARIATKPRNPAKAFKKGLAELKIKDLPVVREALFGILGIIYNPEMVD